MADSSRISIIVPLYNKERVIARALRSITAQSLSDFEVIVVNDGSTDSSVKAARAVNDERIRIVHQENRGPGAARNRGAAEARGGILAFLDGDDEWLPHFLEHGVKTLEVGNGRAGAAVLGYRHLPSGDSTEAVWRRRGLREGLCQMSPDTPPDLVVSLIAYMSPWNTLVRRSVFERWGGFCDAPGVRYAEDSFLWLKLVFNETVSVSLTPPCALYHTEDSELTARQRGARPIEPFLLDPTPVRAACPRTNRPLLEEVLARRALKTACMLGYWGRWREARTILNRFPAPNRRTSCYFIPAHLAASPAAPVAGAIIRSLRPLRKAPNRPLVPLETSISQAPQRTVDTARGRPPG